MLYHNGDETSVIVVFSPVAHVDKTKLCGNIWGDLFGFVARESNVSEQELV